MRKLILIAIVCAAVLWEGCKGCKENNTELVFGTTSIGDTSYVLASSQIPALEPHNVLVEEFTGQSCPNCPAAHELLDAKIAQPGNGTRINLVCYYASSTGVQAMPPNDATYDLRETTANSIKESFFADFVALPSGGVDRKKVGGRVTLYSSDWGNAIDNQKTLVDSVNIALSSKYDTTHKKATITVLVTYINPVTAPHNLSVVIVEDSVISSQEVGIHVVTDYLFNDIYRDMLTSVPSGDPLTGTKEAGRVFRRVFTYTPHAHNISEPAPNPKNLRIVAFVSNASTGDYTVVQSKQANLVGQ